MVPRHTANRPTNDTNIYCKKLIFSEYIKTAAEMSPQNVTKEYTNGEVTIVWKPALCMHSTKCFNGLPSVFDPNARPWINMEGSDTDGIIDQVKKCPSGALSFYLNEKGPASEPASGEGQKVEVTPDGPILIHGNISLHLPGGHTEKRERMTALCRCGASANKPFCDGSHRKVGFKG